MQNAKDTFYISLRSRLAAVNPARIMTLRSVVRPGILVAEAESPTPQPPLDAFSLSWTTLSRDMEFPVPLARMICEIQYATAGTQNNAGLDRGRALAAMDAEVLKILYPYSAQKVDYTQNPPVALNTLVFWSNPEFGPAATVRDRLSRTAKVTVFAFQEGGES